MIFAALLSSSTSGVVDGSFMNNFVNGEFVRLTEDHNEERKGTEFRVTGVSTVNDQTLELIRDDGTAAVFSAPAAKLESVRLPDPGPGMDAAIGQWVMGLGQIGPFPPFSTEMDETEKILNALPKGAVQEVSEISALGTWIATVRVPNTKYDAHGRSKHSAEHAICVATLELVREHPDIAK